MAARYTVQGERQRSCLKRKEKATCKMCSGAAQKSGFVSGEKTQFLLKCTGRNFLNCKALNVLFCKLKHISKFWGTPVRQFMKATLIHLFCPCQRGFPRGEPLGSLLRSPLCLQSWQNYLNPKDGCWWVVHTMGPVRHPGIYSQGNY